jgi:hypothetical protein
MDRDGDDAARFACLASTAVSGHERLKLLERGVAGRGLAVLSGADESEDAHVAKISPSSTLWTRMYEDDYVNETVPGWDVRLAVMLLRAIAGNDESATFDWRAYRAFLPRLDELTHRWLDGSRRCPSRGEDAADDRDGRARGGGRESASREGARGPRL